MKSILMNIKLFVLVLLLVSACKNYDELVKNPNLPASVPPSILLTGILNDMGSDLAWTSAQEFNQFYISTYTYYGTNNYDQAPFINSGFNYLTLENVARMESEALNAGYTATNPYAALGKFFRAYYFNLMSQKFGDLPASQALQGATNPTPKYDSQKQLYIQILQLLDDSNTIFNQIAAGSPTGGIALDGDIYLNNNLGAWQKIVNSFTLRVLVSLSNQAGDADLNIKQKFATILSNSAQYPILTGNSDNMQFVYNAAYVPYPKTPGNYKQTNTRENISATILNLTSGLNDPRTYIIATPAPNQIATKILQITSGGSTTATVKTPQPAGTSPNTFSAGDSVVISGSAVGGYNGFVKILSVSRDASDTTFVFTYNVPNGLTDVSKNRNGVASVGKKITNYTAYVGASPGDDMGTLGINSQGGVYSFENVLRYAATFDGSKAEPAIIIGYPELCFNIAEGINLGWTSGSASTWYIKGITASMNFLGIQDKVLLSIGDNSQNVLGTVSVSLTNYLAQAAVQYKGNNANGLSQILTQKYIAFWQNSGWEAFFNQRRTGQPAFLVGPGTGNNQKLPLRWQYPYSEASANAANYSAAVQSQYGGTDNINGKMWILQ